GAQVDVPRGGARLLERHGAAGARASGADRVVDHHVVGADGDVAAIHCGVEGTRADVAARAGVQGEDPAGAGLQADGAAVAVDVRAGGCRRQQGDVAAGRRGDGVPGTIHEDVGAVVQGDVAGGRGQGQGAVVGPDVAERAGGAQVEIATGRDRHLASAGREDGAGRGLVARGDVAAKIGRAHV